MRTGLFRPSIIAALLLGLVLTALAGCATNQVRDNENLMSAAGFKTKNPQTPEQQAKLDNMDQHKLLRWVRDGQVYYVYADREGCNCLYVGTEQQHSEFQRLVEQRRIADDNLRAAEAPNLGPVWW